MADRNPDDPKPADSPPDDGRSASPTGARATDGAAGAAAAQAPESPLRPEDGPGANRRRSDRVVVAIPVDVSGTDLKGVRFVESCWTEMVSLHGASIALPRRVSAEYPLTLRRRALGLEIQARVLGQLGIRPGFHVYGLTFVDEAPDFWGIRFPPLTELDNSLVRTLLKCSGCSKQVVFSLNEIEFRVFNANQRLLHDCETCGRNVVWSLVPNDVANRDSSPKQKDRKHLRTKMKAMACIQELNREDDVVEVLDISRGGISFRGTRAYEINSWIHFAVPFTPGAANIFVPGRIAWRKNLGDERYEHGVQYVKG